MMSFAIVFIVLYFLNINTVEVFFFLNVFSSFYIVVTEVGSILFLSSWFLFLF